MLARLRLSSEERVDVGAAETAQPGTIYQGDCVEVMRRWPDASFDACHGTPYNISRRKGLKWALSLARHDGRGVGSVQQR